MSLWETAPEDCVGRGSRDVWGGEKWASGDCQTARDAVECGGDRCPSSVAAKDKEKEGRGTTLIESHLGKVKGRAWVGWVEVGAGSDTSATASESGVKARAREHEVPERRTEQRGVAVLLSFLLNLYGNYSTQRVFVRRLPPFLSVIGFLQYGSANMTRRALTIRRTTQKGMDNGTSGVFLSSSTLDFRCSWHLLRPGTDACIAEAEAGRAVH
ncbi:hypothetical protein EDB87DRAFT_1578457 [Lactarius vividus]|nr:hypothetical protein EDB87DRAFT_1578457 [Lactarius vividus]